MIPREHLLETIEPEALSQWYRPAQRIRVGILLLGDALQGGEGFVDDALRTAGHEPLRRKARLQPRSGEHSVRFEDAVEFVQLYGHEYALCVATSWLPVRGREVELVEVLHEAGCVVVWETKSDDIPRGVTDWGVDALMEVSE